MSTTLEKVRKNIFIVLYGLFILGAVIGIFTYSGDKGNAPKFASYVDLIISILGLVFASLLIKIGSIRKYLYILIGISFLMNLYIVTQHTSVSALLHIIPFYVFMFYYLSNPISRIKQNISLGLLSLSVIIFVFQIVLSLYI